MNLGPLTVRLFPTATTFLSFTSREGCCCWCCCCVIEFVPSTADLWSIVLRWQMPVLCAVDSGSASVCALALTSLASLPLRASKSHARQSVPFCPLLFPLFPSGAARALCLWTVPFGTIYWRAPNCHSVTFPLMAGTACAMPIQAFALTQLFQWALRHRRETQCSLEKRTTGDSCPCCWCCCCCCGIGVAPIWVSMHSNDRLKLWVEVDDQIFWI